MHPCRCEFCHTEYQPRPQVINPRACGQAICQRDRQRANERAWRVDNRHLSSKEYHRVRREQRGRRVHTVAAAILKCIEVGSMFLGQPVDCGAFSKFLIAFLSELGIRRANKFWQIDIVPDVTPLG